MRQTQIDRSIYGAPRRVSARPATHAIGYRTIGAWYYPQTSREEAGDASGVASGCAFCDCSAPGSGWPGGPVPFVSTSVRISHL